ncbi:phage tail tube protein [uncultured Variovorax sp.]|jgi:hypothetical protein|uniref:phage tail tube protein n=1 Tax=uncultured Variovorax sp. TaxID=114708 RepID=UPI00261E6E4D|nr:phage tail tube protein [uncultured Variovorax sp.]
MACASKTIRVATVVFNNINHTPVNKTALIKLGGEVASDGVTDNKGRWFGTTTVEPAEIEFEFPLTVDFNPDNYRGQCGDLMFLTVEGMSYLSTNAQLSAAIEVKDAEGKVKLAFKGDAAVVY